MICISLVNFLTGFADIITSITKLQPLVVYLIRPRAAAKRIIIICTGEFQLIVISKIVLCSNVANVDDWFDVHLEEEVILVDEALFVVHHQVLSDLLNSHSAEKIVKMSEGAIMEHD